MTTVGGDITPASEGDRLLTVLMILTGMALIPWQLGCDEGKCGGQLFGSAHE